MTRHFKYIDPLDSVSKTKTVETVDFCPLCSSTNYTEVNHYDINHLIDKWIEQRNINPFPDAYRDKTLIQKKCDNCGLYYYNFHISDSDELYECLSLKNYYPKFRQEFYIAETFVKQFKPKRILEIGCGCGNFLLYIKNFVPNCYGVETNPTAIKLCREKGVYNVVSEDISNIQTKFDTVCHFELLEHIFDTKSFIKNNLRLVDSGGKIIFGTPDPEGILSAIDLDILDLPPHHQFLFSYKSLEWIKNHFGLSMVGYKKTEVDMYRFEMYCKKHKNEENIENLKLRFGGDTHVVAFEKI